MFSVDKLCQLSLRLQKGRDLRIGRESKKAGVTAQVPFFVSCWISHMEAGAEVKMRQRKVVDLLLSISGEVLDLLSVEAEGVGKG